MKKVIVVLLFAAALLNTSLQAQTESGKMLLGVSSMFSLGGNPAEGANIMSLGSSVTQVKSSDPNFVAPTPIMTTNLNISPRIGLFIAQNLALGIDLNFAYSRYSNSSASLQKRKEFLWAAGPFVRCYISRGTVKPFLEINTAFGRDKTEYNYHTLYNRDDEEIIENVNSYGFWSGMATNIGTKASFDFLIGYSSIFFKEEDVSFNERVVTGTFGVRFGFSMYLGKN